MSPVAVAGAWAAIGILTVGLALTGFRLLRGPHLADRVIALDLLAVLAIVAVGCLSVVYRLPVLLDAALVIGLLAFLSTVAFARYMERES